MEFNRSIFSALLSTQLLVKLGERLTQGTNYLVVIIRCGATYGAHLPDVPGCIATSKDLNTVRSLIRDGLVLHLEGMLDDGDNLPEARTTHFSKTPSEEEEMIEQMWIKQESKIKK